MYILDPLSGRLVTQLDELEVFVSWCRDGEAVSILGWLNRHRSNFSLAGPPSLPLHWLNDFLRIWGTE